MTEPDIAHSVKKKLGGTSNLPIFSGGGETSVHRLESSTSSAFGVKALGADISSVTFPEFFTYCR